MAVPTEPDQWTDQLSALITQLGQPVPIAEADLEDLAAAAELVLASIAIRRSEQRW